MDLVQNKENKDDKLRDDNGNDNAEKNQKEKEFADSTTEVQNGNPYLMTDIPPDKQVTFGLDFSAEIVDYETPSEAEENRRFGRRLMCCVLLTVLMVIVGVTAVVIIPLQAEDINTSSNCWRKETVIVKSHIDRSAQTILLEYDDMRNKEDGPRFDIWFDYNLQLAVYKEDSSCYIARIHETFDEGKLKWKFHQLNKQTHGVGVRKRDKVTPLAAGPMERDVLELVAGTKISDMCLQATYWVMKIDKNDRAYSEYKFL